MRQPCAVRRTYHSSEEVKRPAYVQDTIQRPEKPADRKTRIFTPEAVISHLLLHVLHGIM